MKNQTKYICSLIPTTSFWDCLDEDQRHEMIQYSSPVSYSKGHPILEEGLSSQGFFIIKSGIAKCIKSSKEGRVATLKLVMPGDPFCYDTFPGSVVTITDTVIRKIPKGKLVDMLNANTDLALKMMLYFANQYRDAQAIAAAFTLYSAEHRLVTLLQDIVHRAAQADLVTPIIHEGQAAIRLNFPLKRQDLADMAGLTLPTTSKLMSQFKRKSLITGTANNLVIPNLQRLQTFTLTA